VFHHVGEVRRCPFPIWDTNIANCVRVLVILSWLSEYLPGTELMLSRSTGYALAALTYLAAQPSGQLAGAREIAASTGIPIPFLWKILRHLNRRKFVRSFKGVHGGYELARPPKQISLIQVAQSIQQENPATHCVFGLAACDERHECLLANACRELRKNLKMTLDRTTIADLAKSKSTWKTRRHSQEASRLSCGGLIGPL